MWNNSYFEVMPQKCLKIIHLWNLKNNTLDEIYDTNQYKNLLKKVYDNNLLPVCERCCWLEVKNKK